MPRESVKRREGRSTKGKWYPLWLSIFGSQSSGLHIEHDHFTFHILPFPTYSLLTLSRVLAKLGTKDRDRGHIGYRDSKLTRILKPSLSGNARMACICCISPAMKFSEESKFTLDIASRTMLVTTNAKRCVLQLFVVDIVFPVLVSYHKITPYI